jgi:hypothetical protein
MDTGREQECAECMSVSTGIIMRETIIKDPSNATQQAPTHVDQFQGTQVDG